MRSVNHSLWNKNYDTKVRYITFQKYMHSSGPIYNDIRYKIFLLCSQDICKICSQHIFLLKQLQDQGLYSVICILFFKPLYWVVCCMLYQLGVPHWMLNLSIKTDGFLKCSFHYGFTSKLLTIEPILNLAVEDLFCKMQLTNHCIHPLLPPDKTLSHMLRARRHAFQLPTCMYNLHKKSFVISCLFKFLAWLCFT